MKNDYHVSKSVVSRLPRYYRFLGMLSDEGIKRISSSELSVKMGLTASQIRQDFNCFGGFGQQGYGYNVDQLRAEIGRIIGINRQYKAILGGAGNLGRAIATHFDFTKKGFDLCGIFDTDQSLIGSNIGGIIINDFNKIDSFCEMYKPAAAVLCIPEGVGKSVVTKLEENNINCFWNFSHYNINADFPSAVSENVHLNDSLMTLCFNITNSKAGDNDE